MFIYIRCLIMRTRDEYKENAIRQKALEMIVNEGFDGLSMQKLARAAGVSPATIYIYFKDRDDLILQLCLEKGEAMVKQTMKNFDPSMPFAEGLRVQWENRARYWLENPLDAKFMEQIKHSPYHEKVFMAVKGEFSAAMGQFVHGAIQRKELIHLPIEIYWSIAFAPLYQLVKFHNGSQIYPGAGNFVLTEELLSRTLELVVKALTP